MMLLEKNVHETYQMDRENAGDQNHDDDYLVMLYHIDHNFVVLLNPKESKIKSQYLISNHLNLLHKLH